eukprot:Em0020g1060a
MATASKPRTGAKTEEQVSLVVNYNARRENFKFFRSTVVVDALSEVAAKFKISEPHTKALLHNGHVMNEEATFGNFEGTTVVHLVNKTEVMSVRTAVVKGIQDHDKYFGFCGSCKLLTKVRPIVNHCGTGVFVFDSTAQPDYHAANPDLTGKCHVCKKECKGKVRFQCTSCEEVGVAFLRLVRKNTLGVPCMNCCKAEEQVFVFPCPNRHCLCLGCFMNYCQVMMNCDLFRTFPEVGYSINCPAPGVQCKESPVLDPHHFCLVDNKGPFYANYKEKSCSHLDLPDTSILCHCKMEIDISSGTEASPRTAPVAATQEDVAGIGWFRSLLRIFSGPVRAPPPASSRGRRRVSCRKCQTVYCCDCKMTWHEGACQEVTEAMKEQEKFKIEAVNAQKGVWPKHM